MSDHYVAVVGNPDAEPWHPGPGAVKVPCDPDCKVKIVHTHWEVP